MIPWRLLLAGPFGKACAAFCAGLIIWAAGYLQGQSAQRVRTLEQEQTSLVEQATRISNVLIDAANRTAARLRAEHILQSELKTYETSLEGDCALSPDDAERLRGF